MSRHTAPFAPARERVSAGHYESADEFGTVYEITKNVVRSNGRTVTDWDVRRDGVLYARESTLAECLSEIAGFNPNHGDTK